jgi:hypothetical protein
VAEPLAENLADLALWVVASVTAYLLATFAGGLLSVATRPRLAALRQRWQGWTLAPLVAGSVRLIYFLGIPYLVILQGSVDLRTFGLIGGDLPSALVLGAGVGAASWIVLALAWRRLRSTIQPAEAPPTGHWWLGDAWSGVFGALCDQAHWGLYRSLPILLWGPYYGVFAGLGLAAAELLAGLLLGHAGARAGDWERGLTRLGLAWVTGLVFLATNSLWACLLVHTGLAWVLLPPIQSPAKQDTSAARDPA